MYILILANLFFSCYLLKCSKKIENFFLPRIWFLQAHAQRFLREQGYVSTGWEGQICDGGHGCFGVGLEGHRNR